MPRWTVTTRDGIEDVGADTLEVIGGALVFKDLHVSDREPYATWSTVTVAYAPTAYITVTRDED